MLEYDRTPEGELEGLATLKFGLGNEMWIKIAGKLLLERAGLPLRQIGFSTRIDQEKYVAILDQTFAPQLERRRVVLLGGIEPSAQIVEKVLSQDLNIGIIAPEVVDSSNIPAVNVDGKVYGPGLDTSIIIEAALIASKTEEDDDLFDVKTILLDRIRNASTQTVNEALREREVRNGRELSAEDALWAWKNSRRFR